MRRFRLLLGASLLSVSAAVGTGSADVNAGSQSAVRMQPNPVELRLPIGTSRTVRYSLQIPVSPSPVDVFFLVDISDSMAPLQEDLRRQFGKVASRLAASGVDIWAGVGAIGQEKRGDPTYALAQARAAQDPSSDPQHRTPPLYQRYRPVGPIGPDLDAALAELTANSTGENATLLSLDQAATGRGTGVNYSGAPLYQIPAGLDAGFRPDSIKVVFLATDTHPEDLENSPPFDDVVAHLRQRSILVLGTSNTSDGGAALEGDAFLKQLAKGTGAVMSTATPVRCGGDSRRVLRMGDPLVCDNAVGAAEMLGAALAVIPDLHRVTVTLAASPVTRGAAPRPSVFNNNVRQAGVHAFSVTYSCQGVQPGNYSSRMTLRTRGRVIASPEARVTCVAPAAKLLAPGAPRRPLSRMEPPAPPGPPAPAAQPPGYAPTNVNPQTFPQSGVAPQQDKEFQLALAGGDQGREELDGEEELSMSSFSPRPTGAGELSAYLAAAALTMGAAAVVHHRRRCCASSVRAD